MASVSTNFFTRSWMGTCILMASNFLLAAALVAAIFLLNCIYNWVTSPVKHVPGPLLAKFTNLGRMWDVYRGRPELQLRKWHRQYGTCVRIGPRLVSVSDPSALKIVYSRKHVLRKSDMYRANDIVVDGKRVENVFSTRNEAMNSSVMKPIMKFFSPSTAMAMEPLIDSTISFFLEQLKAEFCVGKNEGRICDIHNWLAYFGWDANAEMTFGSRMGFLEQKRDVQNLISITKKAFDYFAVVGQLPLLDDLLDKNPIHRIGPPAFGPAVALAMQRTAARQAGTDKHDKTSTPDFLDMYLEAKSSYPDIVDDQMVVTYLMINVTAGTDTTAIEIRAILYYLCKNKEAMHKLMKELDMAQVSAPVGFEACQRMSYLEACCREGIRLHPALSGPFERNVGVKGLTLPNGLYLPPSTVVGMSPWVVHMDKTVFGQDAEEFNPERWLRADHENDQEYHDRLAKMRDSDLAFGYGKRQCAGRHVAWMETTKVVASLLVSFDIELVDPQRAWKVKNAWFVHQSDMDVRLRLRK